MAFRSDLAMECLQHATQAGYDATQDNGVAQETYETEGFYVTKVRITSPQGAAALGKPQGEYDTLDLGALMRREEDAFPRACTALCALLRPLLHAHEGAVLVVGLGNRAITPDAIGPTAISHVLATRHLIGEEFPYFQQWRAVSTLSPGVLGQTGVESGEVIYGLIKTVQPCAVIAVDALAAGRLSRLLKNIQVSNTGIVPGAGVGNARFALTEQTLGVPVIAVGVPTVVDGATLAHEIARQSNAQCDALEDLAQPMVVTTRDIDKQVADVSRVIGYAINQALHPHLSITDIDQFLC